MPLEPRSLSPGMVDMRLGARDWRLADERMLLAPGAIAARLVRRIGAEQRADGRVLLTVFG